MLYLEVEAHVKSRDGVEGDIQSDKLHPGVNERGKLLDGVVTHVHSLKTLEEVDWLGN